MNVIYWFLFIVWFFFRGRSIEMGRWEIEVVSCLVTDWRVIAVSKGIRIVVGGVRKFRRFGIFGLWVREWRLDK